MYYLRLFLFFYILFSATLVTASKPLTFYAAASLTEPVNEIITTYEHLNQQKITTVHASSSILARQIHRGAPADLFFSANTAWINYLIDNDKVHQHLSTHLLSNNLVLAASKNNESSKDLNTLEINSDLNLPDLLNNSRIALGNPDHVPVGVYSKQALSNLNLWDSIKHSSAFANNARSTLAFVERGATPLAILYKTDALSSSQVNIIGQFPDDSHDKIIYSLVTIKQNKDITKDTSAFYQFLQSDTALNIFKKYGFTIINNAF